MISACRYNYRQATRCIHTEVDNFIDSLGPWGERFGMDPFSHLPGFVCSTGAFFSLYTLYERDHQNVYFPGMMTGTQKRAYPNTKWWMADAFAQTKHDPIREEGMMSVPDVERLPRRQSYIMGVLYPKLNIEMIDQACRVLVS